jgi:hypothetical protein
MDYTFMLFKNISGFAALAFLLSVISCKHEIPGTPGTGGGTGGGGSTPPTVTCSADTVYFQQQVLPIFISNCSLSGCHDVTSHRDGVILTDYQNIINTGDIRPFRPGDSEVYEKITDHDPDDRMPPPPRNPLSSSQINTIYKWIMQGAKNNSCQATVCDSGNVTYNNTIKPLVANKCLGCHSSSAPAAGYDFSQHAVLKARAMDGKLWGSVNHNPGFSPMPKNGLKLTACELTQVRKWIDAGAPNN